jgi:cephalosporin-C deacetylase
MKKLLKCTTQAFLALVLLYPALLAAGTVSLDWSTDKDPVSYLPDEPMIFKVQLLEDGKPLSGKILKWARMGDDSQIEKGEAKSSESQSVEIKTSLAKPGFVHLVIEVFNEGGKTINDTKGNPLQFDGGAGVLPEKLEGFPEPADFDAFWTAQKKRLAEVPLKFTLKEVPSQNPDFVQFDVKVDCAGGKPVSGYLTRPKDSAPKSLQAQVGFMGYGVASANPEYQKGKLVFNINAHGIDNGRDADFYKQLSEGELKGYAFNKEQNSKPETCYFNGMMLRVMRALEFIKAQPEWDEKTLIVTGGSQGGFQALTAAGLDSDVTSCLVFKPWCCDLGGGNLGRIGGWKPEFTQALSYYDPVNHAKRIGSKNVMITSGLGDYICPPSTLSVLYNNIKVPKQITYSQGTTHGYDLPNAQKQILSAK